MPKKSVKKEELEEIKVIEELITPISSIEQHFGNADLNVLRDKINEIIAKR